MNSSSSAANQNKKPSMSYVLLAVPRQPGDDKLTARPCVRLQGAQVAPSDGAQPALEGGLGEATCASIRGLGVVSLAFHTALHGGNGQRRPRRRVARPLSSSFGACRSLLELQGCCRARELMYMISHSLIRYCKTTRDYLCPSVWGPVEKGADPYANQSSGGGGCCLIQ